MSDQRKCNKCEVEKPVGEFYKRKARKDGISMCCKECDAAQGLARRAANTGKANARSRAWRTANPERAKAQIRAWGVANPEKVKASGLASAKAAKEKDPEAWMARREAARSKNRAKNPGAAKEANAKYRKENPARCLADSNLRRARKLHATPVWADSTKILAIYKKRDRVQTLTGVEFHVDHTIPLKGKNVCGLHTHENLRVITAVRNMAKGNRNTHG